MNSFQRKEFHALQAACGLPGPSTTDIAAWSALTKPTGVTAASYAVVGLFGYDMSCITNLCASVDDYHDYCDWIAPLGLDGWSLGFQVRLATADYAMQVV